MRRLRPLGQVALNYGVEKLATTAQEQWLEPRGPSIADSCRHRSGYQIPCFYGLYTLPYMIHALSRDKHAMVARGTRCGGNCASPSCQNRRMRSDPRITISKGIYDIWKFNRVVLCHLGLPCILLLKTISASRHSTAGGFRHGTVMRTWARRFTRDSLAGKSMTRILSMSLVTERSQ